MKKNRIYTIWDNPPLKEKEPDFMDFEGNKYDWDNIIKKMIKRDV